MDHKTRKKLNHYLNKMIEGTITKKDREEYNNILKAEFSKARVEFNASDFETKGDE